MADFLKAFPLIGQHEGGYSNTTGDRGGETYAGVTRKNFPHWAGWAIVDEKPRTQYEVIDDPDLWGMISDFYLNNFWNSNNLSQINSQRVANFTFDWTVNSGSVAIKHLQKESNVLSDGILGPESIERVNQQDENTLMPLLIADRIAFYNDLVVNNQTQQKFLKGWIARANSFA